jgi:hypothetical protein
MLSEVKNFAYSSLNSIILISILLNHFLKIWDNSKL